MARFKKLLSIALRIAVVIALSSESIPACQTAQPAAIIPQVQQDKNTKKEKKKRRRDQKADRQDARAETDSTAAAARDGVATGEEVEIVAYKQSRNGDILIAEGYVNVALEDMRLQADRVTFNSVTGDMIAEGNVIFDEGTDQRVTARRAEINWASRKGVFWDTTGFTNRTQTGEYIFFIAARVEKTGEGTYDLTDATVTACEEVVPKWSFSAKHAELVMGDRLKLYSSIFRVKGVPAFLLPYAWIPATRSERKSGFLLPTTGTSNQKGRTLKLAYYQTLGQSADITFRNDIYTSRGIGMGAEFRAQTDEKSYVRLGVFTVKDRLFGEPGENQGGTAFVADGVQYFPHGWLAVGNVSLVTSLRFRQVFSDDISQVVDPRRESTFYANNNTGNFSVNFLASNETTTLFRPNPQSEIPDAGPTDGENFDIKIRQAPQFDLTMYPRRVIDKLPIYVSFDSSISALKREETVEGNTVLVTPAAVQRFDFQSKVTAPLATFAGIAVTPSLALRETFYTSSLNPNIPVFDPDKFALSPNDPRFDPASPEFKPGLKLFDRSTLDPITAENLSRHYAELAVDIRPPSLEKVFLNDDGSRGLKHLIEPSITYRLIRGIGDEFDNIIRFDERDAVANTNEIEYAVINRFFTSRSSADVDRKRNKRIDRAPSQMEPVRPDGNKKGDKKNRRDKSAKPPESGEPEKQEAAPAAEAQREQPQAAAQQKPLDQQEAKVETQQTTPSESKKPKLEQGEQAELAGQGAKDKREPRADQSAYQSNENNNDDSDEATTASNEDAPVQAYEALSVKVAQKYFFDRDFGGAIVPGRRNQFYPINTLSGFTRGGRARSFSPLNVQVRYRPLSTIFADVRMDLGLEDSAVRNVTISGGWEKGNLSVSTRWHLSRRIDVSANRFEAGTFPGNQIVTTVQFGDETQGLYWGTRIGYDFTDRFVTDTQISTGRLRNSRSYFGYAWDCCGVQFNYNTFKAGLRNESAFSFTFTLAGLGSFGTDQFSQLGGGRGARRRGKRSRRGNDDSL